jgi:hypothetical protein
VATCIMKTRRLDALKKPCIGELLSKKKISGC